MLLSKDIQDNGRIRDYPEIQWALVRLAKAVEGQAEEIAQLKAEKQQGAWGAEMQRSYPATDTVQP